MEELRAFYFRITGEVTKAALHGKCKRCRASARNVREVAAGAVDRI